MVRLNVVGITYNQIESGMYALVLEEEGGGPRLPIIIGYSEAQAIECMLQNISTPRPLTHEFASDILNAFGMEISEVVIRQMDSGTFSADVTIRKGDESHVLDARSSDAIAMAMRNGAPILTSRALLERCGIQIADDGVKIRLNDTTADNRNERTHAATRYKRGGLRAKTGEELASLMREAVAEEDYERADEIKKEMERRQLE